MTVFIQYANPYQAKDRSLTCMYTVLCCVPGQASEQCSEQPDLFGDVPPNSRVCWID